MSRVNPDPHDEGYVYQPTQAVTARFPAGVDDQAVERALIDAGFLTRPSSGRSSMPGSVPIS